MRRWAYTTPGEQIVILSAANRGAALRQLNLILKQKVSGEDRALVEIDRVWFDRILGVHEDAVYDTMAEEAEGIVASFSRRTARADVNPVRQRTQFTCMSTSMAMCLRANGTECTEDEVNRVMGAKPMKGARWEEALACAQHYGMRATLTMPATVLQLKAWTDRGVPVMIAWNPEGRDWSHASVVFDVTEGPEGRLVHVADPNIPNPEKTVRVMPEDEFYGKWYEKWPDYLVRRPALAIEREITVDGRQVMASRIAMEHPSEEALPEKQLEEAKAEAEKEAKKASTSWEGWVVIEQRSKKAFEIYVDEQGMAHDDEGNSWFVGREYGPKTYGLNEGRFLTRMAPRGRPSSPSLSQTMKDEIAKNLVAYALKGLKAKKGISFLNDLLSRGYALSYKQRDWYDNIARSNSRYTKDMPDGITTTPPREGEIGRAHV